MPGGSPHLPLPSLSCQARPAGPPSGPRFHDPVEFWPAGGLDYLHDRQDTIQDTLAARHLGGGTLVLYDVSSAAFEGRTCPLGAIGHPKDGVHGRLQIVYGLLTSRDGIPVAIEVFKGNTGDPTTVAAKVTKVKDRSVTEKVVLVGDRACSPPRGCAGLPPSRRGS